MPCKASQKQRHNLGRPVQRDIAAPVVPLKGRLRYLHCPRQQYLPCAPYELWWGWEQGDNRLLCLSLCRSVLSHKLPSHTSSVVCVLLEFLSPRTARNWWNYVAFAEPLACVWPARCSGVGSRQPMLIGVRRHATWNLSFLCAKKRPLPLVYTGRTEAIRDKKGRVKLLAYRKLKIGFWSPMVLLWPPSQVLFPPSVRCPLYISELRKLSHFSVKVHFPYLNAFVVPITATMQCFLRVTGEVWKGSILNK